MKKVIAWTTRTLATILAGSDRDSNTRDSGKDRARIDCSA